MTVPPEDLRLPDDVAPRTPARPGPHEPGAALVTGASGFLGAALVADLLEHTTRRVHCLVRPGAEGAAARTEGALRSYGLWRPEWADRVVSHAGDLARPGCGLDPPALRVIADEVGTVYHCGAGVNVSYPYETLRGPNVRGTVEVLRLVCSGRPKRLAHISTVSVLYGWGTDGEGPAPRTVPDLVELGPTGPPGGYALSKWAAEQLVVQARERGVDARVFRVGTLAGHSVTGVSNPSDYAWLFLRTCAALRSAPLAATPLQWAPVDFAARAVTHLTVERDVPGAPPAYHLVAPDRIGYTTLFSWMRRAGHRLRVVDFELWRRDVIEAALTSDREEVRRVGITLPSAESDGAVPPDIASDRTDALLAEAGVVCPRLDEPLFRHYLELGARRGELMPPPLLAGATPRAV